MEIVIKTDLTEQEAIKKLSELRKFFEDSEFEVSLVVKKVESMSGHVCNKYSFKIEKKDA